MVGWDALLLRLALQYPITIVINLHDDLIRGMPLNICPQISSDEPVTAGEERDLVCVGTAPDPNIQQLPCLVCEGSTVSTVNGNAQPRVPIWRRNPRSTGADLSATASYAPQSNDDEVEHCGERFHVAERRAQPRRVSDARQAARRTADVDRRDRLSGLSSFKMMEG